MSKIIDAFGREATQGEDGIWRTDDGIAIGPTDNEADVLYALSGMAPAGWVAPPDPPNPIISTNAFIARFTDAEKQAVMSSADWQVRLWVTRAASAGEIDLSAEETRNGLAFLAALGLIKPDRVAALSDYAITSV